MPKARRREPQPNLRTRFRLNLSKNRQRELAALLLIAVGVLTLLALFEFAGAAGALWANLVKKFMGDGAYAAAVLLVGAGLLTLVRRENVFDEFPIAWGRLTAFEVFFVALLGLWHMYAAGGTDNNQFSTLAESGQGGGYLGWGVAYFTLRVLNPGLTAAFLVLVALIALRFAFDWSPLTAWLLRVLPNPEPPPRPTLRLRPAQVAPPLAPGARDGDTRAKSEEALEDDESEPEPPTRGRQLPLPLGGMLKREPKAAPAGPRVLTTVEGIPVLATPAGRPRRRSAALPPLDMLEVASEAKFAETDANRKARVIEETLEQFGIPSKVIETNAGPTVTQFGLEPGFVERRGLDGKIQRRRVPVNRIMALSNDLALALAAAPIRIEAPVPGRSMVGIEVPNEQIAVVSLRGVMESEVFKKMRGKTPLPVALGQDVSGAATVADLIKMPHLLIAGATGSGKSVCINALIASLLCVNSPEKLRLVMVDPKRVELVNFNGVPHLVGPVITEVEEVIHALRWAVKEMEDRLKLFSEVSKRRKVTVRNIDAYNQLADAEPVPAAKDAPPPLPHLPYIVIIIDELADLMLAAPDEAEKLITRLAQLARATGIHLILATQRPSVDVVTGLIKANFPARISFAVTSSVDSRVVLDTPGAEKLLGRGDMLYMAPDSAKLARLQGCFVSDIELARLVNFWREKAVTDLRDMSSNAPWDELAADLGGNNGGDGGDEDLINRATEVIRKTNTASTSFLQRKLGIGYPRAARLMDELEERGIVGPDQGGGKRDISVEDEPPKRRK